MENNKIKALNDGIKCFKKSVEEANALIKKLEDEKKKLEADNKKKKKELPNGDKFVGYFFDSLYGIIDRDLLNSPFFAKKLLSEEEDIDRLAKANPKKDDDMVHHPKHYQGKMECIDAMEKEYGKTAVEWFCLLNAFKYEFRRGKKTNNGNFALMDLSKRNWYITKFNELRASEGKTLIDKDMFVSTVNKYKI